MVFGAGNADAELMFVGEAPGANEDQQGLPFVGQAGKLLDKLLGEIGLARADVFIANVLKCRPPGQPGSPAREIENCRPYLRRQVELIEPTMICTLGNFATKLLRGDPTGISRLHGQAEVLAIGAARCGCTRSTTRRLRCTRPRRSRCCARTSTGSRSCWRSARHPNRSPSPTSPRRSFPSRPSDDGTGGRAGSGGRGATGCPERCRASDGSQLGLF